MVEPSTFFCPFRPIPNNHNQAIGSCRLASQREYLVAGGMPEAVLALVETGSFLDVEPVNRSIAGTYLDDFSRYGRRASLPIMQKLFHAIPRWVGRKVKYAGLVPGGSSYQVRSALDMLVKARVTHRVVHSHCSGLPLRAEADDRTFKLLCVDVGLMSHLCGWDRSMVDGLDERRLVNEGPLAEQFIGQHLAFLDQGRTPPDLTYWLREAKSSNAEVDFVVALGPRILPIEVKAGKSGSLRSLQQFVARKGVERALRFDLNPPSRMRVVHATRVDDDVRPVDFELVSWPLYLVEQVPRMLAEHGA